MDKLPKPTKEDRKRQKLLEKRVKAEGVQLDQPKGKELFEGVLLGMNKTSDKRANK